MKVTLINHTDHPEKMIAIAARMCYSKLNATEMVENLTEEKCLEMVQKITETGHDSILEHISFTFIIEGVSRVLTHQLVRHRIASYHQRSQRYVDEGSAEFVTPPSIANNEKANEVFSKLMMSIDDSYKQLVECGIPKEDARYVLSNATTSQIVVTMNARTLIHFFGLRCCMRAQWEIREMTDEMLKAVRKVLPSVFNTIGPNCFTNGKCTEGKMSCKRMAEMRNVYGEHPEIADCKLYPVTGEILVRDNRYRAFNYHGMTEYINMPGWYSNNGTGDAMHCSEDLKVSNAAIARMKKKEREVKI